MGIYVCILWRKQYDRIKRMSQERQTGKVNIKYDTEWTRWMVGEKGVGEGMTECNTLLYSTTIQLYVIMRQRRMAMEKIGKGKLIKK